MWSRRYESVGFSARFPDVVVVGDCAPDPGVATSTILGRGRLSGRVRAGWIDVGDRGSMISDFSAFALSAAVWRLRPESL